MKPVILSTLPRNISQIPKNAKDLVLIIKHKSRRILNILSIETVENNYVIETDKFIYLVGDNIGISDESPVLNKCYLIQLASGTVKIPHIKYVHPCKIFIPGYTFISVETDYCSYVICLKQ